MHQDTSCGFLSLSSNPLPSPYRYPPLSPALEIGHKWSKNRIYNAFCGSEVINEAKISLKSEKDSLEAEK